MSQGAGEDNIQGKRFHRVEELEKVEGFQWEE